MIKKFKSKKYAFVDSQNLNLAIRDLRWELNFKRFRVFLREKYEIEKAFLFLGFLKNNENLYESLRRDGFELIFKPTLKRNGKIKGNCDAELVLHCAKIEFENFEKAILISGDGDFHCLVEFLIAENKLLKVGIPNRKKFSSLLRGFRKYFFFVEDLREKLEYKKGRRVNWD